MPVEQIAVAQCNYSYSTSTQAVGQEPQALLSSSIARVPVQILWVVFVGGGVRVNAPSPKSMKPI